MLAADETNSAESAALPSIERHNRVDDRRHG
jgi:hypothetical protein